ncbi:MAG: iron chelate uptake ABC transporter family permease subunit, partial [Bacilli bacterium]
FPGAPTLVKMLVAFVFALVSTWAFMLLLQRIRFQDPIFIPLVGMMLGGIISSFTSFIAFRFDLVQNIEGYLDGDFSLITKGSYELIFISVPFVALAIYYAHRFTIAGMGESFATSLGISYKKIIWLGLAIVAVVSASIVISVGVIPFVGLIIPNIVRMFYGDNVQSNIMRTGMLGVVFLLLCDIVGRIVIFPYEISISVVVGVVGGALFLWILVKERSATT